MYKTIKPVPPGYHAITPSLTVDGAAAAIEFYGRAFGAEELERMTAPDGRIVHAELRIGDSVFMLADPVMGGRTPAHLGGSHGYLYLYVDDADAVWQQALAAGAQEVVPLGDAFWGDRFGKLRDPFGHEWGIATHVEDVAPGELARRQAAAFGGRGGGGGGGEGVA